MHHNNEHVRQGAIEAQALHYLRINDDEGIEHLLTSADPQVKEAMLSALAEVAFEEDISSYFPAIFALFADENEDVGNRATAALGRAIANQKTGQKAISVIIEGLKDKRQEIRSRCINTLSMAAMQGEDISLSFQALGITLSNPDATIRNNAALALLFSAHNGADVFTMIPALQERDNAKLLVEIIETSYWINKDSPRIKKLMEKLEHVQ
jgi:HEAT repeat protein